jgi:glycosyltransferase involved in cell wall biosynthesis
LRIAHVLSSFGMGGQERVALDLAVGQRALGHEVQAISLAAEEGPLALEFQEAGVATHTVAKRDGFDVTLFWRLARHLMRSRIDIVHTHNPQPLIYGAPAARLARAGAVHTKHGANPDGGRRLFLRRAAARLTGAYVAVSQTTAEVARKNREVPEAKLYTIENGIDLSRFAPDAKARAAVRTELSIPQDAEVAGTVGRLAPEKDQALFIRAMQPTLSEKRQLIIIGDGPERAALEALAGPYVHLLGARRDTPRLYAALDVFVLSSKTEGLPLVIPEAMAAGLPVVSTAVGGIPTVVREGETGLLTPAGDAAALGAALERLFGDRALAASCGRKGREQSLARYSRERMVRDYLALYEMIIGVATASSA